MGQRTDHLAPLIVDGCDRMADHDAALIDDTDQAAAGKAILQRPVHRRLIHFLFNLSDDIALVQIAVRCRYWATTMDPLVLVSTLI